MSPSRRPRAWPGKAPLVVLLVLMACCEPAFSQSTTGKLVTTFTQPSTVGYRNFGLATAAVGTERLLVGANVEGAAYLFSRDGGLLWTFTSPEPSDFSSFGGAVAAVGTDRILIGASGASSGGGAAYLFDTDGTLVRTFTQPAPLTQEAGFGYALAAVDGERVVIGAYQDDAGAPDAGSAYLFDSSGAELARFVNPTPTTNDIFGSRVAVVGTGQVAIAAPGDFGSGLFGVGSVYLFDTDGTRLRTFNNPTPAEGDFFGSSLARLGTDRIVIGASADDSAAPDAGAAYVFDLGGTLLATIVSPDPSPEYLEVLTAVGNDRVLVGTRRNSEFSASGAAYLFSADGTLLTTFVDPAPADFGYFGISGAALDNDSVVISATGVADGDGAAYLYSLPLPPLHIARNASTISLNWTTQESGLVLQETEGFGMVTEWENTTENVLRDGSDYVTEFPISGRPPTRFFRLSRP